MVQLFAPALIVTPSLSLHCRKPYSINLPGDCEVLSSCPNTSIRSSTVERITSELKISRQTKKTKKNSNNFCVHRDRTSTRFLFRMCFPCKLFSRVIKKLVKKLFGHHNEQHRWTCAARIHLSSNSGSHECFSEGEFHLFSYHKYLLFFATKSAHGRQLTKIPFEIEKEKN